MPPPDPEELARRCDPRLRPYLLAASDAERKKHLAEILLPLEPLFRRVLHRPAGRVALDHVPADDLLGAMREHVGSRLHDMRLGEGQPPIEKLEPYCVVATTRLIQNKLRKLAPEWKPLQDRIRYRLKSTPDFAMWVFRQLTLCGLAAWEGSPLSLGPNHARLVSHPADVLQEVCPDAGLGSRELPTLLRKLFEFLGSPVAFQALVTACAAVLGVGKRVEESLDAPPDDLRAHTEEPDDAPTPLERIVHQERLRRVWEAIRHSPRRAAAFLLRQDWRFLYDFAEFGVASLEDIAGLLSLPVDELDLPMTDPRIAAFPHLGFKNPAQVTALRYAVVQSLRQLEEPE